MNTDKPLPTEIKWRGSTYTLVSVENDKVVWVNNTSRHSASCSVDAWKAADPYEGKL